VPEVNGSVISEDLYFSEGEELAVLGQGSEENGCADRRRIACVMVGWKGPPYCEYFMRCIGRVWPKEKNMEVALQQA
jgi:hypothetical protein